MPQRPRRHRLGDEGPRLFEGIVEPRFKFYPRPRPEYGIDGELEEFDKQDSATGLHFFVQVKGTDEADLNDALAETIDIDTANSYREAPLPVLMVGATILIPADYETWHNAIILALGPR